MVQMMISSSTPDCVSRYGASIINQVKLAGLISLRKDLLSTGIVPDELRRQR